MPVKTYDMPLISSGLRQEEFIRQMVDSLEYLEVVSNDIFNLISISVAEQKDKLIDINNRINKAEAKVDKLKTSSSRGTIVYSLTKYPAPPVLEDQRPIFSKLDDGICKAHRSKGEIISRLEPANDHHIKESTAYYILPAEVWPSESELMEGGFKRTFRKNKNKDDNEGLGSLPRYLPSIASLMLFNTSENLYLKYIIIDPLSGVINKTREQHDEREGPSEAPMSILTREDLTRHAPGTFGYRPIMSAISEIDVPDILPDLPNVAEDIMYDSDLGPSIAPSLANVVLPTLPDMETSSIISGPPPSISDLNLPLPTPLPPDPNDLEPPPPDNFMEFRPSDSEESTPAASPEPEDDRDALLRQIESFKKKDSLMPMQQRHERKIKKQRPVEESEDIMSQLKNRLNLRREGISGHKKEGGAHMEKRESMLEQMSYIIPPPADGELSDVVEDPAEGDWTN